MKTIDTTKDFKENYKILIGSILPRPIAVVSTLNDNGTFNFAPFSFFTGVSANPMVVAFCPVIRTSDGQKKDTVINIEREKEFVINICTESMADQVNNSATELPYGESEFDYTGLTPIKSEIVKAPRIKESPIQFECKLLDIVFYGLEPGNGSLITGQVHKAHIDESLLNNGRIDTDKLAPIGRGAGNDWIKTNNRVQFERKQKAQIQ